MILRIKRFSIRSGKPNKPGSLVRELLEKAKMGLLGGSLLGGVIGGGVALDASSQGNFGDSWKLFLGITAGTACLTAIVNGLFALGANRRLKTAQESNMVNAIDYLYADASGNSSAISIYQNHIVRDKDPKRYKVSLGYENGKMVMILNKPSDALILEMDDVLERVVRSERKADYTSEKTKWGYIVYIVVPSLSAASDIIGGTIDALVETGGSEPVNLITKLPKSFNIK